MKAIQVPQFGSAEVLQVVDLPTPEPGPDQVLVKVAAASLNYIDVALRSGAYPVPRDMPYIPGVECSGVVEAIGQDVTSFQPGQHVFVLGRQDLMNCYAEYVVADSEDVTAVPSEVDLGDAAAIPVIYLTAHLMLQRVAHVQSGQTLLVHAAAGGVGTAIIQLADARELNTIGLTSSDQKMQFAREQGCQHVVNYKTEDVAARVREITGGRGVDVSLNSVAGNSLGTDFDLLAPLGQVIWYGMAGGPPTDDLTGLVSNGFGMSQGIRTFALYSVVNAFPEWVTQAKQEMVELLADGYIKPPIHERIPLNEAVRAHQLLESGQVQGKLLLVP